MKTILRNFCITLMRFKLSSVLNILGLGIAFAVFIVIAIQVKYEVSFDKCYQKSGRIYRVEMSKDSITYSPLMCRPLVDLLTSNVPQIESASLFTPWSESYYCTVERDGEPVGFQETIHEVYPCFLDIFNPEIIEGGDSLLRDPSKVIIPLSMARRFFGDSRPYVGREITLSDYTKRDGSKFSFQIEGVYRDMPSESSFANAMYRRIGSSNIESWANWNYVCYLTLRQDADRQQALRTMQATLSSDSMCIYRQESQTILRLTPIEDVYFQTGIQYESQPTGNRAATVLLVAIAFLIVLIASINFVNFSTSLIPLRIRSVNVRKVFGAPTRSLRLSMVCEALGIALLGFGVAVILVDIVSLSSLSTFLTAPITFDGNMGVMLLSFGLAVVVGVMSGIYPALYSTSFAPALVLTGSFGLSARGRVMRTVLIGVQFVISIALIVGAMFMQLQNSYIRSYDSGVDGHQVIVVELSQKMANADKVSLLTSELKSNPLVVDVAFASGTVGVDEDGMRWSRDFRDGINLEFYCLPVSSNFCDVMGLRITDGRGFQPEDDLYIGGRAIFNETARKRYSLILEDTFSGHADTTTQIVGFVEDFNYLPLRYSIEPMALYEYGCEPWSNLEMCYIRTLGDPYVAAEYVSRTLKKIDSAYPFDIRFYDSMFDTVYQRERKATTLITSLSLLAILISLVGVFGLVVFETQYRRREIGLRKVYGSTVVEILAMFNRRFVWIVAVCFAIAAPAAYYGVSMWLKGFACRTPLHWWVFAAAGVIVMLITLLTVTIQSYRAATENPVNSVKS